MLCNAVNLQHFPSAAGAAGRIDCTLRCLSCGWPGGSSTTRSWGNGKLFFWLWTLKNVEKNSVANFSWNLETFVFFIPNWNLSVLHVLQIPTAGDFQAHFRAGVVAQDSECTQQHAAEASWCPSGPTQRMPSTPRNVAWFGIPHLLCIMYNYIYIYHFLGNQFGAIPKREAF